MTINEGWQFWFIQSFLLWSSGGLHYWWLYKLKMLVYLEDCTILIISICFLRCEISLLTVDCLSIAGMEPVEFHSVTRVGSGYSMYELTELIQRLLPHWQQVIPGQCPSGLVWTKEKPDVWITPQNSYILEVYFQFCFFQWYLRIWIAWHWNKYENYEDNECCNAEMEL